MGVHILRDEKEGVSCMYCSVTGVAFGNIFYDEDPDDFISWLHEKYRKDPRELSHSELQSKIYEWRQTLETKN